MTPKWLDNAHLQPCTANFEVGKFYRCYWNVDSRPIGYRAYTVCQCELGYQEELCFSPKNKNDLTRYMCCAFNKIEDMDGNVVLRPPKPVAKCDRCKNLYDSDDMKLYRLKKPTNGEEFHLLCKECAEKFKRLYETRSNKE
jgi:hypothetical protein